MQIFLAIEDWIYHRLDCRWRERATVEEIRRRREWLLLDENAKINERIDWETT